MSFTSQGFPYDRDVLFEPLFSQGRITLFSHLMNHHTSSILVRNESSKVAQILQNYQLRAVTEMFYKNCFHTELDSEYVACPPRQSSSLFDQKVRLSGVNLALETRLPYGIMVYNLLKPFRSIRLWSRNSFLYGNLKVLSMFPPTDG